MLKKSTYLIVFIVIIIVGTSAILSSGKPPTGYTGAPGGFGTCGNVGCHNSFPINPVGGSVTVTGLPLVYTPGAVYNFSLDISHFEADRTRWGFSITAHNSLGASIGTFSTTNPNASLSADGTELSHLNAPVTAAAMSFTFDNLTWTAPAEGSGTVTFYYAGNAANNDLNTTGDYIYTGSTISGPLPISLYSFNASVKNNNVLLSWQTAQEINSNYFTIQKSTDNRQFNDIGKIDASGNSSLSKNYSFTDDNPSYFEKPIYYRIAIVDKDGATTYSTIENVILKATSTYVKNIYPNPVKPGSTLHLNLVSKDNEVLLLKLIDNSGRLIKSMELNAQKGSNTLDVRMPVSATGNYKLFIKSGAGMIQEPVMIR